MTAAPAADPHKLHPLFGKALLSFAAAGRELPSRTGGHAHAATLWRWSAKGVRTPGGLVRLERVQNRLSLVHVPRGHPTIPRGH